MTTLTRDLVKFNDQVIAEIEYDNDLTQPWVLTVSGAEVHRANTWTKCHNFAIYHYKRGTLPAWDEQQIAQAELEEYIEHQAQAVAPNFARPLFASFASIVLAVSVATPVFSALAPNVPWCRDGQVPPGCRPTNQDVNPDKGSKAPRKDKPAKGGSRRDYRSSGR